MQKKNDLTECATINDLIIMRGHETPENHTLTTLKGFSTVSEVISDSKENSSPQPDFEEYTYVQKQVDFGVDDYRRK